MEPLVIGNAYEFPMFEYEDELTYNQENAWYPLYEYTETGYYIGDYYTEETEQNMEREYYMFYVPHRAEIVFIRWDAEIAESGESGLLTKPLPNLPLILRYLKSPLFRKPRMTRQRTPSVELYRIDLIDLLQEERKERVAKKLSLLMAMAPASNGFSGGPLYKRVAATYKNGKRGLRATRGTANATRNATRNARRNAKRNVKRNTASKN